MGLAFDVDVGDPLLLSLTQFDGASGLYPQAVVRDSAGALMGTFDLSEIGSTGQYTSTAHTPTIEDTYTALFITYTDAGHSVESSIHGRDQDSFHVTDIRGDISRIAVTGAAINQVADSVTVTTGTPTGVVADTFALDASYYQVAEDTGEIDFYFEFLLPADGVPTGVSFHGRLDRTGGAASFINAQAWNWTTSAWDGIGTLASINNSTVLDDSTTTFALLTGHVGTGANLGKVRVRFEQTGFTRSEELFTDQIFTSYAVVFRSVGYAEGAIWIDTINGSPGTTPFFNGVADNPVDTLAHARTLALALGLRRFMVAPRSSLTLANTYDGYSFDGTHWDLALGGQSISATAIIGADVNGTATAAQKPHFFDCEIQTAALPACHLHRCVIAETITLTDAGTYNFDGCSSGVAGTGTPTIDMGAAVGATELNMRHYSGGVELENFEAADKMSLEGWGQLILAASCTGGEIAYRGHFPITDNAGGAVTVIPDPLRQVSNTILALTT